MKYTYYASPVGPILVAGDTGALCVLSFTSGRKMVRPEPGWTEASAPFGEVLAQLEAYFAGELRDFDLPLAPSGTDFQLRVWWALAEIPYGETISYGELARRVGRPSAARAVGAANGSNPLPIVLPCHRVIGSNGQLTGYGGGLDIKERLLAMERRVAGTGQLQGELF